jgi:hypothetical protein
MQIADIFKLPVHASRLTTSNIWSLLSTKSIQEIATTILFNKSLFKNLSLQPNYLKKQSGIKYPLIHHYINSSQSLGWDHKRACSVSVGILQRVYFVFYNLIQLALSGSVRFDERKDFFLLKILETIDLETFHSEKEFLDISWKLRQQITKELKVYKDINFQIIARQIVQKIDAIHRFYLKLPLRERQAIYLGLPPFVAQDFNFTLLQVKQNGLLLEYCPIFQNDMRIVKAAYLDNPSSFEFASDALKNNPDFLKSLIPHSEKAFFIASEACQDHPEVIKELLLKNGKLFVNLPLHQRQHKENVIYALSSSSFDFSVIDTFNNDKDIILLGYSKGCPLKLAHPSLCDDEDFVLKAIELRGWDVYNRASERVKGIAQVKIAAYKKRFMKKSIHPDQIERLQAHCPQIFDDEEFILHFLKTDGAFFANASARLKGTKTIILAALRNCPAIFHDIDKTLLDKNFVVDILRVCGQLYPYIDDELKDDPDVYKTSIFQNPINYYHLPKKLQEQSSLIKELILNDPQAISIVRLDKLTSEDALEILQIQGSYLNLLPFRKSVAHIKAALSSAPHLIHTISKDVLSESPELLRLYLLNKLDKGLTEMNGFLYLPKPLDKRFLNLDQSEDFTAPEEPWEGLLDGHQSDLYQFVESLTQEKLSKAKFRLFNAPNIEDTKTLMKTSLSELCLKLKAKAPYLGTPRASEAEQLNLFYETLYFYLRRLCHVLKKDPSLFNERLQILEASSVCGGGLLSQLSELDRQLIIPPCADLSHLIAFKLSRVAYQNISLMTRTGAYHSVHRSNLLKWHFSDYIGGKKLTYDHLADDEDEVDLSLSFFRLYNPRHIAKQLCEELALDEDFYQKINQYINDVYLKEFAKSKQVQEAKEKATIEFLEMLDDFESQKAFITKLHPHLIKLNLEQKLQAISIITRPGTKELITKILEVTFQKKIDSEAIEELFDQKTQLVIFHKFVSRLVFFTKISSVKVVQSSIKDLKHLYDEHFEELEEDLVRGQFDKLYQGDSGVLNTSGMIVILESLGFLEKFKAHPV